MENQFDIIKLIKNDISEKTNKYIARKYYNYKQNKDNDEFSFVDISGRTQTISEKSKLYTNYFRMIVNQKIDYLFAKEPSLKKNQIYSSVKIVSLLEDLLLNASQDTVGWMQFYIEDNDLDWLIIPDKEIIPFYDRYNKKLEEVIKYFLIEKDVFYVEHWTLSGLNTYKIHKDKITDFKQQQHFKTKVYYNENDIEKEVLSNFKSIPFIPLYNNKSKESDLVGIKELLDMYNSINSGLIENINIFQEFIVKLKGFAGDNETLQSTLDNMVRFKAMSLPDNSDADYMKVDIPTEARKLMLDVLKENIFLTSQSMDPTKIGDGNLTNIVIQSRYAALDMKANRTEKQVKIFYEKFVKFIKDFYKKDFDDEINCNRSMLFNITEAIKNCNDSKDVVSNETILDNHPFVKNTKEELKRIEKEKMNNNNNKNIDDNKNINDNDDNND